MRVGLKQHTEGSPVAEVKGEQGTETVLWTLTPREVEKRCVEQNLVAILVCS